MPWLGYNGNIENIRGHCSAPWLSKRHVLITKKAHKINSDHRQTCSPPRTSATFSLSKWKSFSEWNLTTSISCTCSRLSVSPRKPLQAHLLCWFHVPRSHDMTHLLDQNIIVALTPLSSQILPVPKHKSVMIGRKQMYRLVGLKHICPCEDVREERVQEV